NASDVSMNIYDVTGKLVKTFDQGQQAAGTYQIEFSADSFEAGVYFYSLNVNGATATRRMIVQ
ncbi:MAG TPA: T9SS type A sorting domain-containing protein, partial [Bacteroidia bacterium]|nr:T9SS type A sorting domain-containing protein [Bacteroidia bacterium]